MFGSSILKSNNIVYERSNKDNLTSMQNPCLTNSVIISEAGDLIIRNWLQDVFQNNNIFICFIHKIRGWSTTIDTEDNKTRKF